MAYELWDAESGNALGAYDSEEEALAVIRDTIHQYGRQAVDSFGLLRTSTRGRSKLIAEGDALAGRALESASAARPAGRQTAVPA